MRMRLTRSKPSGESQPQGSGAGRHRLPPAIPHDLPAEAPPTGVEDRADDYDLDYDEELSSERDEESDERDEAPRDDAPSDEAPSEVATSPPRASLRSRLPRAIAFGVLPALLVLLGGSAGYLTWKTISARFLQQARVESVRAATDGATALLTYHAASVDSELRAARERLTGKFKVSYTAYTHEVVIPDAHKKHISSIATVPSAASVWATTNQAVVMLFVNQTFNSDTDTPAGTASSVRVTLDKVSGRWLISDFTPV
jgi:Mce-associated membrane protein